MNQRTNCSPRRIGE